MTDKTAISVSKITKAELLELKAKRILKSKASESYDDIVLDLVRKELKKLKAEK